MLWESKHFGRVCGQVILREWEERVEFVASIFTLAGSPKNLGKKKGTVPFCHRIERDIRSLCDDGHLVASDSVDEAAALHHGFGSDEHDIDFVHNVRHGGV